MEKKFNFVYLTTNLINDKQYIGDHSTNNLNDVYFGSGRPHLKNALKKYGKKNFKREILEQFDTKQEAFNAQEKYIKEYNTLAPNGYNLSPKGGLNVRGCFSEETIKKLSGDNNSSRRPEVRKKLSEALKGKKASEESKQKNKLGHLGKTYPNRKKPKPFTEEHKQKISKNHVHISGEKHHLYGKTLSNEQCQKISNSNKGKVKSEAHKENIRKGWIKRKEKENINKKY